MTLPSCLRSRLRRCLGLPALASLALPFGLLGADEAVFTTAAQVRALSAEEAALGLPVRLHGVYLGEADPEGIAFVVQDETEGIYVQGPGELVAAASRGDVLEIEGTTDPGGFAPYVVARTLRKRGEVAIPEPIRVTLDDLNAGQLDAKWVEISGIVRSVEPKVPGDLGPPPPGTRYSPPPGRPTGQTPKVKMKLAAGSARVVVEASGVFDVDAYVDAEVTVRGLCFNLHNRNRQFVRPFVQVPRGVGVVITRPPPEKPFCGEPRPVSSLLRFDQLTGKQGHRVHVHGVVLHHDVGTAAWIRDGAFSLRVQTTQREALKPGDEVDVLGFPALGTYTAVLEDAVFRKGASQAPPVPHVLDDLAAGLTRDADLVQLDATLTEVRRYADSAVLTLDRQGRTVSAQIRLPDDAAVPSSWLPGTLVRVAGVCAVLTDGTGPLGGLWEPRGFQLLMRTPADLAVLQPPPWWTTERLVWILSGFLTLAVVAVALVMLASRRRLKEQEQRRAMAETEFAAILNERNRVAREIHDTLAQNLGAISVQLELARPHAAEISPAGRNHLATAHKLARAALSDARESIWNMRSQVLEKCDLAEALERILRQMTAETGIRPEMEVTGSRRRLPPVVENNLLRIGQEGITNACRHGKPSRIRVHLTFERRSVCLVVEDDGVGFVPEAGPASDRRSFGLVGMRERVELLGGSATIRSAVGEGTRIEVVVGS